MLLLYSTGKHVQSYLCCTGNVTRTNAADISVTISWLFHWRSDLKFRRSNVSVSKQFFVERKTHTFLLLPFNYKTYNLKCNLLKEDLAFFVPRGWTWHSPLKCWHPFLKSRIIANQKSVTLGSSKFTKNLKRWLQEVWTRGCVMSVHLFVRMFCIWVPCWVSAMEK